ncbi:prephenate dehydratase [Deinococcus roseus]|uniref:prephenate dehydratase n=1 Tax=Deinococcus roseus TaxID=392414 RepID=A0ABQ2CUS7_9DEIO|nr:prephenate dehydratase [Deinococcus roseus]GGJ22814.1 prephenate dehydratase [Deinococcus roseus]
MSKTRVAFQGVPGAYSEIAALNSTEGEIEAVGYASFQEVLNAVMTGECDLAALPVENSLAGTVIPAVDELSQSDLHAIQEVMVRVHHQLLVLPGVKMQDIEKVYSHPQALAQCDGYFKKHGLKPVPAYDTAGSAKDLAESGNRHAASVASRRAAELYGLDILAENIEDEDFNTTRFLVLSKNRNRIEAGKPYKTSIIFAVRHQPGSLIDCLSVFRDHGVNLCRIESRPRRDKPWSYLMYVDFEGHTLDSEVQAALAQMMHSASFLKILGSYPSATVTL